MLNRLQPNDIDKIRTLYSYNVLYKAIKEACLAYDADEAERLCGEITGCSVNGEPLKPVLDEILASAEDFEYEAAAAAAEKFA